MLERGARPMYDVWLREHSPTRSDPFEGRLPGCLGFLRSTMIYYDIL